MALCLLAGRRQRATSQRFAARSKCATYHDSQFHSHAACSHAARSHAARSHAARYDFEPTVAGPPARSTTKPPRHDLDGAALTAAKAP